MIRIVVASVLLGSADAVQMFSWCRWPFSWPWTGSGKASTPYALLHSDPHSTTRVGGRESAGQISVEMTSPSRTTSQQIEDDHAFAKRLAATEEADAIAAMTQALCLRFPDEDFDHLLEVAKIMLKQNLSAEWAPRETVLAILTNVKAQESSPSVLVLTSSGKIDVLATLRQRYQTADPDKVQAAAAHLTSLRATNAIDFYRESEKLAADGFFGQEIQLESKPFTDTQNTDWSRDGVFIGTVNAQKERIIATPGFIARVREQLQKDLVGFGNPDIHALFDAHLTVDETCGAITAKASAVFNEIVKDKVKMGYAVAKGRCLVSSVFQLLTGRLEVKPSSVEVHTDLCNKIVDNGIASGSFTAGDVSDAGTVSLLTIDANNIRYIIEHYLRMPNTPVAFHVMRGTPGQFARQQVVRLNIDKDGEQVNHFIHQGNRHWVPMFPIAEPLDDDKIQFEADQARAAAAEVAAGALDAAILSLKEVLGRLGGTLTAFADYEKQFIDPYKDHLSDSANSVERDEFVTAQQDRQMQLVTKFVARMYFDRKQIELRPRLDRANFDTLFSSPAIIDAFIQNVASDYFTGGKSADQFLTSHVLPLVPMHRVTGLSCLHRQPSILPHCMPCSGSTVV